MTPCRLIDCLDPSPRYDISPRWSLLLVAVIHLIIGAGGLFLLALLGAF